MDTSLQPDQHPAQPAAVAVTFGPWRRSSYSNGGDNCAEAAQTTDGRIGVRDSKNPGQAPHLHSRQAWTTFLAGVRSGEFEAGGFSR